jgi:uncharacterized integral membrane protein
MHFTADEVTAALKSKTLLCTNPVILSSISIYLNSFHSLLSVNMMIWVLLLSYTHIVRVFDPASAFVQRLFYPL